MSLRGGPFSLEAEAGFVYRLFSIPGGSYLLEGRAAQGGVSYRKGPVTLFAKGRETDTGFYAPYAMNDAHPLRRWELGGGLSPFRGFACGASHGSEKRLLPLAGDDAPRITSRQSLWMKLAVRGGGHALVSGRRVERIAETRDVSYQGKAVLSVRDGGPFGWGLSCVAQERGGGGVSWSCGIMADWRWRRIVHLSVSYVFSAARDDDPVYVHGGTLFRTATSGRFVDGRRHMVSCGLTAGLGGAAAGAQYGHRFAAGGSESWNVEVFFMYRM
jgi:hypothetical protein